MNALFYAAKPFAVSSLSEVYKETIRIGNVRDSHRHNICAVDF